MAQKQQSTCSPVNWPDVIFMQLHSLFFVPAAARETPQVADWDGQTVSRHCWVYVTHGHCWTQTGRPSPQGVVCVCGQLVH